MSTKYNLADMMSMTVNCRDRNCGDHVMAPYSEFCKNVVSVLKQTGYVSDFEVVELRAGVKKIKISIRFNSLGKNMLTTMKLFSKPSCRVYYTYDKLRLLLAKDKVKTFIVSTSSGVCSADEALEKKIGGELLCTVF